MISDATTTPVRPNMNKILKEVALAYKSENGISSNAELSTYLGLGTRQNLVSYFSDRSLSVTQIYDLSYKLNYDFTKHIFLVDASDQEKEDLLNGMVEKNSLFHKELEEKEKEIGFFKEKINLLQQIIDGKEREIALLTNND